MNRAIPTAILTAITLLCSATGAEPKQEAFFALVVTNNQSLSLGRPHLQYADDDGARYYRFFGMVAPSKNLALLTTFDRDSRQLYPDLIARAKRPTRKHVERAIERLAKAIAAAKAEGKRTVFYFVFAGHGDAKAGKGFLELEDGRLSADDLEKIVIRRIGADVQHLILDSCNSFFVINPRKPGGRRWATPKDFAQGFSKRYPNVGVMLSTSESGEVYEWSEVQSGIFSHEVRSGLSGAADIDRNGRISYQELAAFIGVANRKIVNAQYRPKVFARGPWGKANATLFRTRWAKGRRITIGAAQHRIWFRDKHGIRLADLNKAAGKALELVLPVGVGELLVARERVRKGKQVSDVEYALPQSDTPTQLASLTPSKPQLSGRGPAALFSQIFAEPFGPASYQAHRKRKTEVYFGLSQQDTKRMGHYLAGLAEEGKTIRLRSAPALITLGAALGGMSGALFTSKATDRTARITMASTGIALGIAMVGFGIYNAVNPSKQEQLYQSFQDGLKNGVASDAVVAGVEKRLEKIVAQERLTRKWLKWTGIIGGSVTGALTIALGVLRATSKNSSSGGRSNGGSDTEMVTIGVAGIASATLLATGITMFVTEGPFERMVKMYRNDPDLKLHFGVAPTKGGFAAGIGGTF